MLQNYGVGNRNQVGILEDEYPHLGSLPRWEIAGICIEDDDSQVAVKSRVDIAKGRGQRAEGRGQKGKD
ncbi:MAG: hypothetical protein RIE73_13940 [Coleofasciculus sp. C1-SOL-03]|jgi:hypothetical protein|uniref:hypothetical protein n=1 Tax=Coleofasciculus sp. C1-SOL-03 TaxID=3069522 RepID=UPI0033044DFB